MAQVKGGRGGCLPASICPRLLASHWVYSAFPGCWDIRRNNLSGSFLEFALKNSPASLRALFQFLQIQLTTDPIIDFFQPTATSITSDLFTNCCSQLIKLSNTYTPPSLPPSATDQAFCPGLLFTLPSLSLSLTILPSLPSSFTVIQPPGSPLAPNTGGIHGGDWDPRHLLKQQAFCGPLTGAPAADALPFWAGVLTQRTGHFAQVIKHSSSQGSIAGVVQKATDVGPCVKGKPFRLKYSLSKYPHN